MRRARVTFGLINRDGGELLADCLRSVQHLVDEMIVVDTGSTDDSPALARSFGATILRCDWSGDFSRARNVYVEAARCPFVLSLDSDEVFPACTRAELHALLSSARAAYLFTVHNYFRLDDYDHTLLPGELVGCPPDGLGICRSQTVRLFPRLPGVRYVYPVHELVTPSLERLGVRVREAPWPIHHLGFVTGLSRVPRKRRHYRELGYRKIAEHPEYARGYLELAKLFCREEELDDARALVQRCLALAPRSIEGYRQAALLALRARDHYACGRLVERGLAIAPRDLDLFYIRGVLAVRRGDCGAALADLSAVAERRPEHLPTQLHLADVWIARGELERAEALLEVIARLRPERADVHLRLAEIAERRGRLDRVDAICAAALHHPAAARALKSAAAAVRAEARA